MPNVIYKELGFPIVLVNPPMVTVRGHEVPDVNLRQLQDSVFHLLVLKPSRFTGAEIRFIRKHHHLRQVDLAEVLNRANHTIVSQWESRGDEFTGMDYNTELVLRIWMATTTSLSDQIPELLNSRLKGLAPCQDAQMQVSLTTAV